MIPHKNVTGAAAGTLFLGGAASNILAGAPMLADPGQALFGVTALPPVSETPRQALVLRWGLSRGWFTLDVRGGG